MLVPALTKVSLTHAFLYSGANLLSPSEATFHSVACIQKTLLLNMPVRNVPAINIHSRKVGLSLALGADAIVSGQEKKNTILPSKEQISVPRSNIREKKGVTEALHL